MLDTKCQDSLRVVRCLSIPSRSRVCTSADLCTFPSGLRVLRDTSGTQRHRSVGVLQHLSARRISVWLVFSKAGTVFAFELQRFFAFSHPECCALRDTSGPRCHNAVCVLLHLKHAIRRCGWLRDCWHCHSFRKDTVCLIRCDTDVTKRRPELERLRPLSRLACSSTHSRPLYHSVKCGMKHLSSLDYAEAQALVDCVSQRFVPLYLNTQDLYPFYQTCDISGLL